MDIVQSKNQIVALNTLEEAKKMVSHLLNIPFKRVWSSYDEGADVLYLNFKKPAHADDSEMTEDDIIIRYEKSEIIGITILNASKRFNEILFGFEEVLGLL